MNSKIRNVVMNIIYLLISVIIIPSNVQAMNNNEIINEKINDSIPASATQYVYNNLCDIISVALYYDDEIGMKPIKKENAVLG